MRTLGVGRTAMQFDLPPMLPGRPNAYFGVPIHDHAGRRYVKESELKKLPFYAFWHESATLSTCLQIEGDVLIFLGDFDSFSELFITTGLHRYNGGKYGPEYRSRTYFGLEIVEGRYVRLQDIGRLPFALFWAAHAGRIEACKSAEGDLLVLLSEWEKFCFFFTLEGKSTTQKMAEISDLDRR